MLLRTVCQSLSQHLANRRGLPLTSLIKRNISSLVKLSEEVQDAVCNNEPVVALESTIITHGMPPPDNLHVAMEVETIVRQNGAIPATVAVLDGHLHVGLSEGQMNQLVDCKNPIKTSRRDLAHVLSQHSTGGTTVSGTMIAANLAGIDIFVTGGVGGVHRGAESTFDISADLTELGRTPVTVVSAGIKSILDIEKTLEYLETQGVFVGTLGTETFPAFFTTDSGFKSPNVFNNVADVAKTIACNISLQLQSGMLIGVPIPVEYEASGGLMQMTIDMAVQEASEQGIKGKAATPFILERVNILTKGQSLESNKGLIKNNAKVGSQIAVELSKIKKTNSQLFSRSKNGGQTFIPYRSYSTKSKKQGRPVVVGGAVVDFVITANSDHVQFNGATYPGHVRQSFGGVGRNVADGLARLGCDPLLVTVIGDDIQADAFQHYSSHMNLRGVEHMTDHSTPSYYAILKKSGELMFGVGDMDLHSMVTREYVSKFESDLTEAPLVFIDGNISADSIEYVCDVCHTSGVPVWFDPTDTHKADKPFTNTARDKLSFISPNFNELRMIYEVITGEKYTATFEDMSTRHQEQIVEEARSLVLPLLNHVPTIFASLGEHGLVVGSQKTTTPELLHYPACRRDLLPEKIVSVSGAGDCMSVAIIAKLLRGSEMDTAVKAGLLGAQYSLQHFPAVPSMLKPELFSDEAVHAWADWSAVRLPSATTASMAQSTSNV